MRADQVWTTDGWTWLGRCFVMLLAAVFFPPVHAVCQTRSTTGQSSMSRPPFSARHRIPRLPEGLTWLNTTGSLDLADLRGKFVLLDFWTYCCINCMHLLPELEKLEDAYPNQLVVIGVHTAKFATEQEVENIREAILRYHIRHPVINDADHEVWDLFNVRAWPTLILIDPEGYAVWGTSGEVPFEELDRVLRRALPYYRDQNLLDETPLRFDALAPTQEARPLRFPGKVLADEQSERLFIADSGHHRIVVCRFDGTLLAVVGSGQRGRKDGRFSIAQFNDPQGMALDGNILYVADNRNHLIRKVDLEAGQVSTLAGTGEQNRPSAIFASARADRQALASPWALQLVDGHLFIAMAGAHQIWRLRLNESVIEPYAGNGREDIVDGRRLPSRPYAPGSSSFAQPSGLACDGRWLYVADSEGSSIRRVPLDPRQQVDTLVGTAHLPVARLFTFGDVDGPGPHARLQHPLGVAFYKGWLYVADTYNSKLKVVDPNSGETRTLLLNSDDGPDGRSSLNEPGGISAASDKLFIADTNNHLVRIVHLGEQNRLSALSITGLQPPEAQPAGTAAFPPPGAVEYHLPPAEVAAADGLVELDVELNLPTGWKINPLAPMSYQVRLAKADSSFREEAPGGQPSPQTPVEPPSARFSFHVPVSSPDTHYVLTVALTYYYCRSGSEGLCKVGTVAWTVPLKLAPSAETGKLHLAHTVR